MADRAIGARHEAKVRRHAGCRGASGRSSAIRIGVVKAQSEQPVASADTIESRHSLGERIGALLDRSSRHTERMEA